GQTQLGAVLERDRVAEDRGQRRPEIMRDRGQERVLDLIRATEFVERAFELLLRALALRDVEQHALMEERNAGIIEDEHGLIAEPDRVSVPVQQPILQRPPGAV